MLCVLQQEFITPICSRNGIDRHSRLTFHCGHIPNDPQIAPRSQRFVLTQVQPLAAVLRRPSA
ncbi:MAG: hypothetical protein ACRC47_11285 [Shewanella sp.]